MTRLKQKPARGYFGSVHLPLHSKRLCRARIEMDLSIEIVSHHMTERDRINSRSHDLSRTTSRLLLYRLLRPPPLQSFARSEAEAVVTVLLAPSKRTDFEHRSSPRKKPRESNEYYGKFFEVVDGRLTTSNTVDRRDH